MTVLWLNVVVGIAQMFGRLAFLHALAPTQTEPPFRVTQVVVLGLFIVLGVFAVRRFHPAATA